MYIYRLTLSVALTLFALSPLLAVENAKSVCSVVVHGGTVSLRSPSFDFTLSTGDGLRAVSWKNNLTGRTLSLGNGPEVDFDLGLPGQTLTIPKLAVKTKPEKSTDDAREAVFELVSENPAATAIVTYRWNDREPVLHKFVTITNASDSTWDRLLNVRLGVYPTDATSDDHDPDFPVYLTQAHQGGPVIPFEDPVGRKRGFPAHVEGQYFLSLAHPAGFATRENKTVTLKQLPGKKLAAGERFNCMEAVYGVADDGGARAAFVKQLHDRMRRVRRGHDKPLAIFEPFGSKADGQFDATEAYVLDNLAKVDRARRENGLTWDYYSIEFWHDSAADLAAPIARNFPNGFGKVMHEIQRQGMKPGLWIDSGQIGGWTIGDNPALKRARTRTGGLCRATEPTNRFYLEGYTRQIKENGVRLFKFDNLEDRCDEPGHEHLSGDYSTEPIVDGIIQFYRDLDKVCPEIVIMLYWRYESPWWLLDADTLFDSGTKIEAASFAPCPTFRARDSVTRRLDDARWMIKDLPLIGWDPLGVWLSDWPWNSCVGKEAWQTGMVMDLCRGHLLAQIWSDTPVLTPPERAQAAEFIALLKARPECFGNSRFIIGSPWKNEPYGYSCSDGHRAFIAINNGVFHDSQIELKLGPAWGLPDGKRWDLYRWYPAPAQLANGDDGFTSTASILLRAMDIVLLEAVPHGEQPTLNRKFDRQPLPTALTETTSELALSEPPKPAEEKAVEWKVLKPSEMKSTGGATLVEKEDHTILAGGDNPNSDTYRFKATADLPRITAIRLEALTDDSLPNHGPGRAENGNFMLRKFTVSAKPRNGDGEAAPVRLARAEATFSQPTHGGWPIAAAIDGKPETAWGIDPKEGMQHEAVFELEKPLDAPQGEDLDFRLEHFDRGHNLGRFRLSVTSAPTPIHVPSLATRFVRQGELPPTKSGGVLAVSVELKQGAHPLYIHHRSGDLRFAASLDEKAVSFQPVVGNGWYPAPWQTWRLEVKPSEKPRPFEFQLESGLPADVEHKFSAHFVPQ
jgi:hypothetical protein